MEIQDQYISQPLTLEELEEKILNLTIKYDKVVNFLENNQSSNQVDNQLNHLEQQFQQLCQQVKEQNVQQQQLNQHNITRSSQLDSQEIDNIKQEMNQIKQIQQIQGQEMQKIIYSLKEVQENQKEIVTKFQTFQQQIPKNINKFEEDVKEALNQKTSFYKQPDEIQRVDDSIIQEKKVIKTEEKMISEEINKKIENKNKLNDKSGVLDEKKIVSDEKSRVFDDPPTKLPVYVPRSQKKPEDGPEPLLDSYTPKSKHLKQLVHVDDDVSSFKQDALQIREQTYQQQSANVYDFKRTPRGVRSPERLKSSSKFGGTNEDESVIKPQSITTESKTYEMQLSEIQSKYSKRDRSANQDSYLNQDKKPLDHFKEIQIHQRLFSPEVRDSPNKRIIQSVEKKDSPNKRTIESIENNRISYINNEVDEKNREKYPRPAPTQLDIEKQREKKFRDIEYNYSKNSYEGSNTPRRSKYSNKGYNQLFEKYGNKDSKVINIRDKPHISTRSDRSITPKKI